MKIVYFAKGTRKLPSSRTRAYFVTDYLKKQGYDAETYHVATRPWWSIAPARFAELFRNIGLLASLKKGDFAVLQRTIHQADFLFLILLRKWLFGRGYAFDFDDAIFMEKGHAHAKQKTDLVVQNADVVFCGAGFLKEYADKLNPHAYVITTSFDTEHMFCPGGPVHSENPLVIGWTGTPVHYDNMSMLVEPLKRLTAEGKKLKLLLVGGGDQIPTLFEGISGLEVEAIHKPPSDPFWIDPAGIVEQLRRFDIGVYPLQKTEWNKGKDTHKAKEFMATGSAVIMSAWGENPRLITNDLQALMVDDDGWYDAFKELIENREHRIALAARGRKWMEDECSFKKYVPYMLGLMQKYVR